ncbi:hypothetical protein BDZ89DRAFT_234147 [Hymenopellis radicata]|nr:hypothetical protein BDZ89DRAFT_234147 [Hymenopellis radicata]
MVATPLYGVICYQAWQYYSRFGKSDTLLLRTMVAVVLLLDTATQCFNSHALYHYLIIHQADVRALADLVWSLVSQAGTGGLVASIVQLFFAYKVYIVSGKNFTLPQPSRPACRT